MTFHQLPQPSTFEKARRREAYRRFARAVKRNKEPADLLTLEEISDRLHVFEQTYVGIRPIPLDKIVGTAGRAEDFDRNFLPRRFDVSDRWKRVERAFPSAFSPIVVYQVGDSYFVVDGHHRVAIARQRGMSHIDAEITRLQTKIDLPPGADIGRIILLEQQRRFMEDSGLDRSRPEARIEVSRAFGYAELLELVKVFGFDLMREREQILPLEEISGEWYDGIYLPAVEAIRAEKLEEMFPHATEGDLFLYVYQRRRTLFPERGAIPFEQAVHIAGQERRDSARTRPPAIKPRARSTRI